MARAKNERNEQFIRAWKEEGLTDRQLQKRFGLSEGGVKGLKARLRAKDHSLYKKVPTSKDEKVTSTSTKRMTFWQPESTIEERKELAAKEKRTASAILRGILGKYLQNK